MTLLCSVRCGSLSDVFGWIVITIQYGRRIWIKRHLWPCLSPSPFPVCHQLTGSECPIAFWRIKIVITGKQGEGNHYADFFFTSRRLIPTPFMGNHDERNHHFWFTKSIKEYRRSQITMVPLQICLLCGNVELLHIRWEAYLEFWVLILPQPEICGRVLLSSAG